jgi:spermidine synthase
MSGLVYEVAWIRSLELVFGATTFAVATVLASFMGGLAAGSGASGALEPRLRRVHPLLLYAACEAGIAATALVVPLAFRALVPLTRAAFQAFEASFLAFSLLRFVLCAAVLMVPTALMGATLPILSRFVAGLGHGGAARRVGLLFAVNTAGAVLGCAMAGLVLLPGIGLLATQWCAVLGNVVAAAGALRLARDVGARPAEPEPAEAVTAGATRPGFVVAAYALSGAVAMLYEVAWNRALVLVLGSSTYSYTTMLTTFLVGLTFGAWLGTRLVRLPSDPLLAIGLCQLLAAAATALGLFTIAELPYLYVRVANALDPSPRALVGVQLLLAAAVMFPPTLGLGAMFPLAVKALGVSDERGAQRLVSRACLWNTVGAIGGAVAGGFWLLPRLGSRDLLLLGVCVNAAVALFGVALARRSALRPAWRAALLALITVFLGDLALAAPAWRVDLMSSGVFRYVDRYRGLDRAAFRRRVREGHGDVLFFEEGLTSTIGVFRTTRSLTLLNNGKPDASVPPGLTASEPIGDLPTQVLLGGLPLLLAPRLDDVLVIGLGSGVTLGSVLRQPVRHVDALELESAVVRASRFFDAHSKVPLADPRVSLVVNDARNDLLVRDRPYDVIVSEPSNPWIPGAASLFTRDFFEIARRRLRPDGILCQWVQLYELWPEDVETILRSFLQVFPAVQVWRVGVDAILIGSPRDLPLQVDRIFARASDPVRADLARIGIRSPEDLLAHFWIGGAELRAAVPAGPLNTDDDMRIEFAAPLRMLSRDPARLAEQEAALKAMFRGRTTGALPLLKFPDDERDRRARFLEGLARAALESRFDDEAAVYAVAAWDAEPTAATAAVRAVALAAAGRDGEAAAARDDAERRFPWDAEVRRALLAAAVAADDKDAVRRHAEALLTADPSDVTARFELARVLESRGRIGEALHVLEPVRALAALPDGATRLLGALLVESGRAVEAGPALRDQLARHPEDRQAIGWLAQSLRAAGDEAGATALDRRLEPDAPAQAATRVARAEASFTHGRYEEARAALGDALQFEPDDESAVVMMARTLRRLGQSDRAAALVESWLAAHGDRPAAVGLLSQLLAEARRPDDARRAAARYRALTGEDWTPID